MNNPRQPRLAHEPFPLSQVVFYHTVRKHREEKEGGVGVHISSNYFTLKTLLQGFCSALVSEVIESKTQQRKSLELCGPNSSVGSEFDFSLATVFGKEFLKFSFNLFYFSWFIKVPGIPCVNMNKLV